MTKQYSAEYFREQGALGGKAAHAQRTAKERKEFMRTIRAARRPITWVNYDKLVVRLAASKARVEGLRLKMYLVTKAKKQDAARLLKNAEKRLSVIANTHAEKSEALYAWRLRYGN